MVPEAVYENGKLKMSKGYGYQDFEKELKIHQIRCF